MCWGLILVSIGCKSASKSPAGPSSGNSADSYPTLTSRTKELTDAFTNKDYQKVLEMTYSKVVDAGGGHEKMLATMKDEIAKMESDGVQFLSTTAGSPTQFVHDGGTIYAVVPLTLKMKAQEGTFQTEGFLIGISPDAGTSWSFIDAAGVDDKDLKVLPANVLAQLKLPADKPPVKIGN
ncbi:MAG TPA: hypothetical protein VE863_13925 [Pyrinomonadaceae bacterium]|jgi:hypothetical protein|nr:hypothetical protein [Pyrinomonadaceae bacterium]